MAPSSSTRSSIERHKRRRFQGGDVSVFLIVGDGEDFFDRDTEHFGDVPGQHQRWIVAAFFEIADGFTTHAGVKWERMQEFGCCGIISA